MKPVVHYTPKDTDYIVVGQSAYVHPTDHYATDRVSNTRMVRTSKVVEKFEDGSFETRNSRYIPA